MLLELKNALKDVFSNKIRGLLLLTAVTTLLVFIGLFALFAYGVSLIELTDWPKMEKVLQILGFLAFFIMSLMLFPAVATFVSGFFVDSVVERTAKQNHVAGLRDVPLSESLVLSGVASLKGATLSAALIPVSLVCGWIPVVNLIPAVLYYVLNGRLLAREYYYAVALRYADRAAADEMFDRFKPHWTRAGVVIALLMTVPVVNVISPLIAMAFMQRLFLEKRQA